AVLFQGIDIRTRYGVTVGDYITIEGAFNSQNNVVKKSIVDIGENIFGTYIILDGVDLVAEEETDAICYFESKYNVWPD
ncbi:MAG: hypothetical protein AAGB31_11750, partial [Bdellovibrio sp.]